MIDDARPNPDRLLAQVQREAARAQFGRLRIFFGATAGVGKTYAMLEAAKAARAAGTDVVIGYVEPHGRVETERLMEGLERLPLLEVRYRDIVRREFNLDSALQRRAGITLVDELAHSNLLGGSPAPRHPKRWQDVDEMLQAGLDVWTTLNVQHLESLNDVVAGITGVRQQETIPDHVFENAAEIELIDLPPDDLLARLKAGKIYLPEQASHALERYFRKPNLIALRELALRKTADRVDSEAREFGSNDHASRPWLARDRFIVGISPDSQAEGLVRFGKRFAEALDAEWIVVSVETPDLLRMSEERRNERIRVLRLAESLGAEAVTLDGPSAAATLLQYARTRNATRIVIGRPHRRGWRGLWRPSAAAALLRTAHDVDVSIIAPRDDDAAAPTATRSAARVRKPIHWARFGYAALVSLVTTGFAALLDPFLSQANLVMIYLLGAAIAGLRYGRAPAALTAVLNVLAFNFLFVEPRLTFAVADAQYLVTFAIMLLVALIISSLIANVRLQTRVAGARERRTALLYNMSRELAGTRGADNMARIAVRHVAEGFDSQAAVLLADHAGRLQVAQAVGDKSTFARPDESIAHWVFDHGQPAGLGTGTLPGATAIYLPLVGTERTLGVLAVLPSNPRRVLLPEQRNLLETFASQTAMAIERAQLASRAESARLTAETESLRNTLLASISHDLRTPLAVITGASTALTDQSLTMDTESRARLARTIAARAQEMGDLIVNVLDLMRFESGRIALRLEWEALDDLLGHAAGKAATRLGPRRIELDVPAELPAVRVDAALITQAIINLLDNVAKHTPASTRVWLHARQDDSTALIVIEDDGPGLPPGDPDQLFAKFQRGREESDVPGAGLGLAICRAIVRAHGGEITASDRTGGGARFEIRLPAQDDA